MELALSPEAQHVIDQNVRSGRYASPEDVVQAALIALAQDLGDFEVGEWDQLLAEGELSIAAEGTLDGEEALAARRQRRAAQRTGT
jgi:Arc/MetJ-type ribon-helix-helix transcriptional regulator